MLDITDVLSAFISEYLQPTAEAIEAEQIKMAKRARMAENEMWMATSYEFKTNQLLQGHTVEPKKANAKKAKLHLHLTVLSLRRCKHRLLLSRHSLTHFRTLLRQPTLLRPQPTTLKIRLKASGVVTAQTAHQDPTHLFNIQVNVHNRNV